MDRVFLDANVLFSAAYRAEAGVARLWDLQNLTLISSAYAVEEARSNLTEDVQQNRLQNLTACLELIIQVSVRDLPKNIELPEKDRPILLAAIDAHATHLLTGDIRHFGAYFGKTIQGVTILLPGQYLGLR